MNKTVIAYLGCRKGSERVKNKNSRIFCTQSNKNLFEIKIEQLIKTQNIESIFFSTDDDSLIKICNEKYNKYIENGELIIHKRPEYYASSKCSGKEYQEYIYNLLGEQNKHILWTHTTSPFLNENKYEKIIDTYFQNINDYDSLMTVKTLKNYILNGKGNIINNTQFPLEKWPATQSLDPLYEVDSGAFIIHSSLMKKHMNRVGNNVCLYENIGIDSTDIDYQEDFEIAQLLWNKKTM